MRKQKQTLFLPAHLVLIGVIGLDLGVAPSYGQTFTVLHNFTGESDGGNPLAGLTIDKNGNLYGTAQVGGANGYGLAFELQTSSSGWTFVPLYNFASGSDGSYPTSRLMPDRSGTLYGVTSGGGAAGGHGTVFSLTPGWKESVLYSFTDGTGSGEATSPNLVFSKDGNIYGTTSTGGSKSSGTVFRLNKPQTGGAWTETVLHTFGSGTDGTFPIAGVTFDAAGNIYGTTSAGGSAGFGTIFELTKSGSTWNETILHDFENATDGSVPYGGLIADKSGNFYGAATQGGTNGGGTIYELTPSGTGWTFNTLYSVPGWDISGTYRNLAMDAAGNLYGTTHCDGTPEAGTVYKLSPSGGAWNYTLLHQFEVTDGQYIFSSLVFDKQGNIYGTAQVGGANGYGVIWEITP